MPQRSNSSAKEKSPSSALVQPAIVATSASDRRLAAAQILPSAGQHNNSDDYSISLDFFSGPMDLLLHLVHQEEVSIEQVSMRVIAERYLEIVSAAEFLDLEKASEYLVIAATLMAIKSASLLPNQNSEEEAVDENSAAFYEELRERLRKYELTKNRARALIDLPQLGVDVFSRVDRKALQPTAEMLAEPESVTGLGVLFGRLMRRVGDTVKTYRIRLEGVSVVSHMMRIVDVLSESSSAESAGASSTNSVRKSFRTLLLLPLLSRSRGSASIRTSGGYSPAERGMVIGSFVAVLELVKRGLLSAFQPNEQDDIQLELKIAPTDESAQKAEFDSEFDEPRPGSQDGDAHVGAHGGDQNNEADSNIVDIDKYRREKQRGADAAQRLKEVGNSGS